MYKYDVIVVGGGVSGSIAAIAAARSGAKTLIIEKSGFLGGSLTNAGVGPMMTFHAGNIQVVQGIAQEVIDELKKLGGTPGHIPDTTGYTYTVTPFDAEILKCVLEGMFTKAGGDILFHATVFETSVKDGRIESIKAATKFGGLQFTADNYIDATGDGDIAALSGVDFQLGRQEDNLCQPVTMNLKVSNVDTQKIKKFVKENPEEFPEKNIDLFDRSPRLSLGGFSGILQKGMKDGEISFSREVILFFETNNPGEYIVNTTRIQRVNPTDSWEISRAETEGRRQCMELFNFLKKRIPGFENSIMNFTGPSLGVRESRKIKGKYCITAEDLFEDKKFEDEIARGGYPVDVHSPDGEGTNSKHLKWGDSYGIPFRSLINEKISNLINVGRCISATHEACAAIRVTPIAMAIGHAGGTAAAIAYLENINVSEIDASSLRVKLREEGAYLR